MRVSPVAIYWQMHCALCSETFHAPPVGYEAAYAFWEAHRHGVADTRTLADVLRDVAEDMEQDFHDWNHPLP